MAGPIVTSVLASPATGSEGPGAIITITVKFSEAVKVKHGKPALMLNDGAQAKYRGGSGTDTLTFDYTVSEQDPAVADLAITGVALGSATIGNARGQADLCGIDQIFTGLTIATRGASAYQFLNLTVPGSITTSSVAINDQGQVVGCYQTTGDGPFLGYVYSNGAYITVANPSAPGNVYSATGINDAGQIVGDFEGPLSGFIDNNGSFSIISDPNATAGSTQFHSINNLGQIVGEDSLGSFVYTNGSFAYLPTNPYAVSGGGNTVLEGINDAGEMVGYYNAPPLGSGQLGFILTSGTYTTLQYPAADLQRTIPLAINDEGEIVGYYVDGKGKSHGFLYDNGTWTTFNPPGALWKGEPFVPTGINDAGQITGTYDPSQTPGVYQNAGFVMTEGIDLTTIAFGGGTTLGYTPNGGNTGGTISVGDGTHNATISVLGQYVAADFHLATDFNGGTYVTDPTLFGRALDAFLASPHT
jgi:probable HAF family extracellular repeat protein